jgi:putative hydrolase of the HAD superfamily
MIEGIVFDLWNTLARNVRPPEPMRLLAEALGIASDRGWARRIERGMMLAPASGIEGGLRQIEAREGLTVRDAAARAGVVDRWSRAADDAALYHDVVPTLAALRGRYRLGLVSNTQSFGLEFLERDGLWGLLDGAALSFEVGALKPRPEIFAAVAVRLGLPPDRLLVVGDRPADDVGGARAAGMQAILLARPAPGAPAGDAGGSTIAGLADLPERLARLGGENR